MIKAPERVQVQLKIALITDQNHPAFQPEKPSYMTFAPNAIAKGTVLGLYGGIIRSEKESGAEAPVKDGGASCCFSLQPGFYVDADKTCNELAFTNDFRLNVHNLASPGGKRRINCQPVVVWYSPTDDDPELFPRIVYPLWPTLRQQRIN
jgi:hypothetical protein